MGLMELASNQYLKVIADYLPKSSYNKLFFTTYNTSSDKFQNYYKDVSLRMKNREIDILIVVNMFLTGFNAITLLGNKETGGIVLLKNDASI